MMEKLLLVSLFFTCFGIQANLACPKCVPDCEYCCTLHGGGMGCPVGSICRGSPKCMMDNKRVGWPRPGCCYKKESYNEVCKTRRILDVAIALK